MEERSFCDMLLAINEFSKTVVENDVQRRDIFETFDDKLQGNIADMGLYGLTLPETMNGLGLNYYEYIKIIECIAKVDCSLALSIAISNTLGLEPICIGGASVDLESVLCGEEYITAGFLNKCHIYILNDVRRLKYINLLSPDGTIMTVEREGLNLMRPQLLKNKLGLRSMQIAVIDETISPIKSCWSFDSQKTVANFYLALGGVALGASKSVYNKVKRYTGERKLVGKPLNNYEINAFKLADMVISIHSMEKILYDACLKKDADSNYEIEAIITKIFAMDKFKNISDEGIQLLGAYGLSREYDIERFYRDQRMMQIIWNSENVDKKILSESILKEETI